MDLKRNLSLGLFAGLGVGGFFSGLLLIAYVAGGDGSGFPQGLTYGEAIVSYLGGGLLGGLLFGLLLPFARTLVGCIVVGMIVISPILLAQAFLSATGYYDAILLIIMLGSVGGYFGWSRHARDSGSGATAPGESAT